MLPSNFDKSIPKKGYDLVSSTNNIGLSAALPSKINLVVFVTNDLDLESDSKITFQESENAERQTAWALMRFSCCQAPYILIGHRSTSF